MPECKNDPSRTYKGDEPSPKGLGYCAHAEEVGKLMKGRNNKLWKNVKDKNGVKKWKINVKKENLWYANLIKADLSNLKIQEEDLKGVFLQFSILTNADLKKVILKGANLTGANLTGANLTGANLTGANLEGTDLTGANLEGTDLTGANLEGAILEKANLKNSNLTKARLLDTFLNDSDLRNVNLTGASLIESNLKNVDLRGANLKEIVLDRINLKGANLEGVNLKEIVLYWTLLERTKLKGADLRGANLSFSKLFNIDLKDANLEGANLKNTNLSGADLRGANLKGSNLDGAKLIHTDLRGANLKGANLDGAELIKPDLTDANLENTILVDPNLVNKKLIILEKDNKEYKKIQLKHKGWKTYFNFFNGDSYFLIYVKNPEVYIYKKADSNKYSINYEKYDVDNMVKNKWAYITFVKKYKFSKLFIGSDYKLKDFTNSFLINIKDNKYVFIGEKIYEFKSFYKITNFVSDFGNSGIPYPWAIDEKNNIYLLLEYVCYNIDLLKKYLNSVSIDYLLKNPHEVYAYYDEISLIVPREQNNNDNLLIKNYHGIKKFFIDGSNYSLSYKYNLDRYYGLNRKYSIEKTNGDIIRITKKEYINLIKYYGKEVGIKDINITKIINQGFNWEEYKSGYLEIFNSY